MTGSLSDRPLWLRWVLSVIAFSLLTAAIVLVVHRLNHSGGAVTDVGAARRANLQSQALIVQDQAPRAAVLAGHMPPAAAIAAAISADVRRQVDAHDLGGPAGAVRCRLRGPRRAARLRYRCVASGGAVSYPFFAVVDLRARRLVWCRQDQVQGSGVAMALDATCLG